MKCKTLIAAAIFAGLASSCGVSKPDLSPKKWGGCELQIYNWLNRQFGLQNALAEGRNGVIPGTTGASAERAGLEAMWTDPLQITYHGYKIFAHGLPAQGGAHLAEALNVAAEAGLAGIGHCSESPLALFWLSQITNLIGLSFLPEKTVSSLLGEADVSLRTRAGEEHAQRVWAMMSSGEFPLTKTPVLEDARHSDAVVAIDQWGNIAAIVHTINTSSWGETGIFVDGVSIPDSAAFQQLLISETGPGKRLPDPTEPLILTREGQPVAALSSIGSGLHQKKVSVLLNLIDFQMDLKRAIDSPSIHLPKYEADGSSRPQVFEGDFCAHLLTGLKKLGLEAIVVPNTIEAGAPRGYVVGASLNPKGGFQGVATNTLNGRALAY